MPSLASLERPRRAVILEIGFPGTGKTGALAALANAGYNLRIADFDGNLASLREHLTDEALHRVEVVSLEDELKYGERTIEPKGVPQSFARFLKLWNNWAYETPQGEKIDLGPVRSWGLNDVLVIDSLTEMGEAIMRRTLAMNNRTILNRRQNDWGTAMADQDAVMQIVTGSDIPCHVIVTSHLKIVAPKEPDKDKDSDTVQAIKEQVAELVPARLYPTALGHQLPQSIARHFSTVLLFETEFVNGKPKRVIRTQPKPEVDVKMPAAKLPPTLPLETGMLTVFEALVGPPPFAVAAAKAA